MRVRAVPACGAFSEVPPARPPRWQGLRWAPVRGTVTAAPPERSRTGGGGGGGTVPRDRRPEPSPTPLGWSLARGWAAGPGMGWGGGAPTLLPAQSPWAPVSARVEPRVAVGAVSTSGPACGPGTPGAPVVSPRPGGRGSDPVAFPGMSGAEGSWHIRALHVSSGDRPQPRDRTSASPHLSCPGTAWGQSPPAAVGVTPGAPSPAGVRVFS